MRQGSFGFGRNPIRVIVYYLLLWRPLRVAKPEPAKPAERWLLCYDSSPLTPHPPITIGTARPPISTGNIGKWLSEIFFGWKNYNSALFIVYFTFFTAFLKFCPISYQTLYCLLIETIPYFSFTIFNKSILRSLNLHIFLLCAPDLFSKSYFHWK